MTFGNDAKGCFETTFLSPSIIKNNKKLFITTCYRVGTLQQSNLEEVNKHLQSIFSNKSIINKHIVLGDFNLDSVKWDNNNNVNTSNNLLLRYTNVFEDHCLFQLLKSPTHYKGNILDLVLKDEPNIVRYIYISLSTTNILNLITLLSNSTLT